MHDPDLAYDKQEVLRAAAGHIFKRRGSAPNVLSATLLFLKRRYPRLWHTKEGTDFIASIRTVEQSELYGDTDKMRAALTEVAVGSGVEMTFGHYAFQD